MHIQLFGVYLLGVITTYIMIGSAFKARYKQAIKGSKEFNILIDKYNELMNKHDQSILAYTGAVEENTKIRLKLVSIIQENVNLLNIAEDRFKRIETTITEIEGEMYDSKGISIISNEDSE